MFYKLGTHLNAMEPSESPNHSQGKNSKSDAPFRGRRFGSLHASLVARYLDSRTAVRLLRKSSKRCSTPGALRLWTFDCYNEPQANELASKVDRTAVIVVRVHWCHPGAGTWGAVPGPARPALSFSHYVTEGGLALECIAPVEYFRDCRSVALVGFPRDIDRGFARIGEFGISYSPEGVALTARDGVAALFAWGFRAPAGATRHFRLRLNGVARTFTSTFEGNDGNGTLHGSSNFCALDAGDEDASSDEVRLDWLPDLPPARFRLENHGDARATFTFDRSLARDVAADDAIKSPDGAFGNLSVLVFPAGRTEGTRGRVGVFLRLMTYDDPRDRDLSRHFDVVVDGRRVGSISNEFGMDRELVGLDDVGASDELFPRRGGNRGQIVVELTERPATNPGWICGACDTVIRCQWDSFHRVCTGCGTRAQFTITRALGVMA